MGLPRLGGSARAHCAGRGEGHREQPGEGQALLYMKPPPSKS